MASPPIAPIHPNDLSRAGGLDWRTRGQLHAWAREQDLTMLMKIIGHMYKPKSIWVSTTLTAFNQPPLFVQKYHVYEPRS